MKFFITGLILIGCSTSFAFDDNLSEELTANSWCRKRYSGTYQTIRMTFMPSGFFQTLVIENNDVAAGLRGNWKLEGNYLELWHGLEYQEANIDIFEKNHSQHLTIVEKDKWGVTKTWRFIECE